jgi:hypothetical protein
VQCWFLRISRLTPDPTTLFTTLVYRMSPVPLFKILIGGVSSDINKKLHKEVPTSINVTLLYLFMEGAVPFPCYFTNVL